MGPGEAEIGKEREREGVRREGRKLERLREREGGSEEGRKQVVPWSTL